MSDSIRGSVVPQLIDALIAAAKEAKIAGTVTDGLPEVLNSGTYLGIGLDDWDVDKPADSANSAIDWAHSSDLCSSESGTITCAAWAQLQGTGLTKRVRDQVFAIHSALKSLLIAAIVAAPSDALGVPGLWDVRVGGVDGLNQSSNASGAAAVLRFSIPFQASI